MVLLENKLIDTIALDLDFSGREEVVLILGNKYLQFLNDWFNLIYHRITGNYGYKRGYVKDMIVGPFAKNDYYRLCNSHIISMEEFEITFKVKLTFDYYIGVSIQQIREIKIKIITG